jgi:general secretion pathway protein A
LIAALGLLFFTLQTGVPSPPASAVQNPPLVAMPIEPSPDPELPPPAAFSASRPLAFADLLATWGLEFSPDKHGNACEYAETFGLACLPRRGDLGDLRLLDRPAILALTDPRDGEVYGTLTSLDDESAIFLLQGETVSLPLAELEHRWLGDFILIWRRPPFAGTIRPGDRGPKVEWLARQFSALAGDAKKIYPAMLTGQLLARLKGFQRASGLTPDGIVGPNTLIHLDSALGGGSPRLSSHRQGE